LAAAGAAFGGVLVVAFFAGETAGALAAAFTGVFATFFAAVFAGALAAAAFGAFAALFAGALAAFVGACVAAFFAVFFFAGMISTPSSQPQLQPDFGRFVNEIRALFAYAAPRRQRIPRNHSGRDRPLRLNRSVDPGREQRCGCDAPSVPVV